MICKLTSFTLTTVVTILQKSNNRTCLFLGAFDTKRSHNSGRRLQNFKSSFLVCLYYSIVCLELAFKSPGNELFDIRQSTDFECFFLPKRFYVYDKGTQRRFWPGNKNLFCCTVTEIDAKTWWFVQELVKFCGKLR